MVAKARIRINSEELAAFCQKWRIDRLWLFGSVLRDDFRPDSDVDVLVSFEEPMEWSLLDFIVMEMELEEMFGRPVDLVMCSAVEDSDNPFRKKHILATAEPVYGP